jgi:hypothetical protein
VWYDARAMDTEADKQDDEDDKDKDKDKDESEAPDSAEPPASSDEPGDARADAAEAPKRKKKKKKKGTSKAPSEPPPPPAKAPPPMPLLIVGGLVIAGLVGGGVYLLRHRGGSPGKWGVGDEVDVEITVVAADSKNLACAAPEEVAGRHCANEGQTKPWSKGGDADDKKILKPYTTTDKVQLTAAGLWSEPAISGAKLPAARFSVKCKYKIEGNLKAPSIRWAATGPWSESPRDWYAGIVSGCTLVNP